MDHPLIDNVSDLSDEQLDENIVKLTKKYFKLFSDKNSREIAYMLSDDVTLTDWEISCSGKIKVMNE